MTNLSDEEYFVALADPKHKLRDVAFKRMFNKYNKTLLKFVNKLVRNNDNSKDIMQEAWLKLCPCKIVCDSLELKGKHQQLTAFLRKVVYNLAMSKLRKKNIEVVPLDYKSENLFNSSPKVLGKLEAERRSQIISKCINALPDKFKPAIQLWMNDLSQNEIADILETKIGTIKSRVNRSQNKLRRLIEEECKRNGISVDDIR